MQLLTGAAEDAQRTPAAAKVLATWPGGEGRGREREVMRDVISRLISLAIDFSRLGKAREAFAAAQACAKESANGSTQPSVAAAGTSVVHDTDVILSVNSDGRAGVGMEG